MMKSTRSVRRMEKLAAEFLVPLRMGDGFKSEMFDAFCKAVEDFSIGWKSKSEIPKEAAYLFVEVHAAMVASSDLYPSQDAEIIRDKAIIVVDLCRECCWGN